MFFRRQPPRASAGATIRSSVLSVLFLASAVSNAQATQSKAFDDQLLRLDPETRLEQTCDAEVMQRINQDDRRFKADKVIAYTVADPKLGNDTVKAGGAVFRSKGEWYRLKFFCRTGPRHLDAQELRYRIGSKIPHEDWQRWYLYD